MLNAPRGKHDEAIALAEETFPILRERMKLHAGKLSGGEQQMLRSCARTSASRALFSSMNRRWVSRP